MWVGLRLVVAHVCVCVRATIKSIPCFGPLAMWMPPLVPIKRKSTDRPFGPKPLTENCQLQRGSWRTHAERKADAAAMRRMLLADDEQTNTSPLPRKPPPPPPTKAYSKELLEEARLLMTLRGGPLRVVSKVRCGECTSCLRRDCGVCANCRDKPRFGGNGVRKRACMERRCAHACIAPRLEGGNA